MDSRVLITAGWYQAPAAILKQDFTVTCRNFKAMPASWRTLGRTKQSAV